RMSASRSSRSDCASISDAPLLWITCCSSRPRYAVLMGTYTAPSRFRASQASTAGGPLGIQHSTRSSCCTPRACSPAAWRRTAASSSTEVYCSPLSNFRTTRCGCSLALRSSKSAVTQDEAESVHGLVNLVYRQELVNTAPRRTPYHASPAG